VGDNISAQHEQDRPEYEDEFNDDMKNLVKKTVRALFRVQDSGFKI
jgi:hypothetical protein